MCRLAKEERSSVARMLQAESNAQERCLAASIWAGDGDKLTLRDGQIDACEDRGSLPIGKADRPELDG